MKEKMTKNEVKKCSSCGSILEFAFEGVFKVSENSDPLFPELPRVGESLIPMNIYVCPSCGKIELFVGEAIKSTLLRLAEKER